MFYLHGKGQWLSLRRQSTRNLTLPINTSFPSQKQLTLGVFRHLNHSQGPPRTSICPSVLFLTVSFNSGQKGTSLMNMQTWCTFLISRIPYLERRQTWPGPLSHLYYRLPQGTILTWSLSVRITPLVNSWSKTRHSSQFSPGSLGK